MLPVCRIISWFPYRIQTFGLFIHSKQVSSSNSFSPPVSVVVYPQGRKRFVTGFDRYRMVADLPAVKQTDKPRKQEIKSTDTRRVTD